MKSIPWFLSPVLIFIGSLVAIIISLVLFIYWSLKVEFGVENFLKKFNMSPDPLLEMNTWVTIFILSILVILIILGFSIIYIYYQKSYNLYRLQNNFINNFTHELKTPLTSMNLFLEVLQGHQVERDKQLEYIDYMKEDANRLSNIINHILSTAKIESNAFKLNLEEIDMEKLIRGVISGSNRFREKIEISFKGEGDFRFLGDKELLEMLVTNIITNSIKYNNSKTPRLKISFERTKKHYNISFSDNGIGIRQKDLKNIFKKFYQVGDSLDVSAKGTGLGLFLSQTIAQIHKCILAAESAGEGQGSEFLFQCPLNKEIRSHA